jgi:uncharacterized membrane protein YccF (DUF307 family)
MIPLALVPLGRKVISRRELDPAARVAASVSRR